MPLIQLKWTKSSENEIWQSWLIWQTGSLITLTDRPSWRNGTRQEEWSEELKKGCTPLKEHLGPAYRAFFESFEDTASWGGDGGRKACKAIPTTPWKVRPPQAIGLPLFEVRREYVDHTITALKHITRQTWEETYVDRPAWMRAALLIKYMCSCSIEPATHGMMGICTLLSCTPGPREGVSALQTITGDQVLAADKSRGYLEIDADTVSRLTQFLNSEQVNWFFFFNARCAVLAKRRI